MTDKELLELAAKAIGLKLKYNYLGGRDANQPWDPLEDDGDALRLAVKLKIAVTYPEDESCVRVWYGSMGTEPICDDLGSDPYAATRRCITRAAAAIGKEISLHIG
jgi:hypothetical protein